MTRWHLLGAATPVLVPPITFLIVGLVGLLVWRRARRIGAALLLAGQLGMLLLALPVVSDALLRGLEARVTPGGDASPQVIIVLGGDQKRTLFATGSYEIGPLSLERERTGAREARLTGLPLLTTGGRLGEAPLSIAELMANSLKEDFGQTVKWTETASQTTWENAEFSSALLRAQGIDSAYLVTQGWHMPRAVVAFKHFGMKVTPFPTRIEPPTGFRWDALIPSVESWSESYFALHEWIGLAFYVWRS